MAPDVFRSRIVAADMSYLSGNGTDRPTGTRSDAVNASSDLSVSSDLSRRTPSQQLLGS